MLIRILATTLHNFFCEIMLDIYVIFKNVIDPDDTLHEDH